MRERQVEHVRAAHDALTASIHALAQREAGEVVASELRRAARAFDQLLGRDVDVDVLDRIFSRFCIGK
jgi:tRNA modification GTPase